MSLLWLAILKTWQYCTANLQEKVKSNAINDNNYNNVCPLIVYSPKLSVQN